MGVVVCLGWVVYTGDLGILSHKIGGFFFPVGGGLVPTRIKHQRAKKITGSGKSSGSKLEIN